MLVGIELFANISQVFSIAQKRWIHVDPSDNIIDAPLMYQYGWKRDIDYIIAFSRDDIQDVTWKYCSDHSRVSENKACLPKALDNEHKNIRFQLLKNRENCSEDDLLKTIYLLRQKRQANCSPLRKTYLKKRTLFELIEMMLPRLPTENERKGRSSGSLNWKLARGEGQSCSFNVI